ncbi:hypothetical protein TA5114_01699 [Cognatishimia activa]|uniref:Uncharacterized protein n=1 Tax=Cognatishimia activa TaxID=1715691 RepID=A0A0P1IV63_9RHOB|nr:hypothetical protein [Cognatishimia activa]CUI95610.1 hypothetical protein TA5113_01878 [Cognatishimia activa]CUK25895.1 hypothetical protein TA5114_01699 [Cognatishimia activa]
MTGAFGPAADARVALKAVASIDRLIEVSSHDLFLNDVLVCAANVLRNGSDTNDNAAQGSIAGRSSRLH